MRRIAAFVVTALVATGCGVELDAEEVRSSRSFPFAGAALTIRSSLGGVRVLPGAGGRVEVERWVRGKAAGDGNATWSLRDGTLRLGANCTMVVGDCGARYHVKVPAGVRLSVDAPDGVILKGLTQDVDASSRERIQVSGTTGRLRLRSEGSITGDALKSRDVRCRTSDGAIDVTFADPPAAVDLDSRDGRVTATVPRAAYRISVRSKTGTERTELKNDAGSGSTITARSSTGDVRVLVAR
ncbi:hypothetical protein FH608_003640 [Nonomuraea phyllanthi]|uniref:Uncharacterized protein n=1 Tax=Nonomuraea phyllanthi TaxID=2219224 RepID=A0A5C4WVJ1_9ACTN|nr:DUF4097 family beta strand repeat-containing protein [Nonomuraea phyllanthi]KAB8197640.1 hypothetical protein FH608_003640 [Nonomuraea phyllanthi]